MRLGEAEIRCALEACLDPRTRLPSALAQRIYLPLFSLPLCGIDGNGSFFDQPGTSASASDDIDARTKPSRVKYSSFSERKLIPSRSFRVKVLVSALRCSLRVLVILQRRLSSPCTDSTSIHLGCVPASVSHPSPHQVQRAVEKRDAIAGRKSVWR